MPGEFKAGIRFEGDMIVTMVELLPQPQTPTVLADGQAVTVDNVPLVDVAECLWQYDINVAGIDVVSSGRRISPGSAYAGLYDQVIGVKSAVTARRTWLVLRYSFDPLNDAVRNRGGGPEGAVKAALAATRRAARRLRDSNCAAVVADPASFQAAHAALGAGLTVDGTRVERTTLATGNEYVTTFRVHPDDVTNENLGSWWAFRSINTTVITRLTPGARRGRIHTRTWVRYTTSTRIERNDRLPGLIRQYGDQAEALTATLPLGRQSFDAEQRMVCARRSKLAVEDLAGLKYPVGPSGQLIGSTPTGHPLLLPLAEPGMVTRVHVNAPLWVAQQMVLRAMAGGATVRVASTRPEQWWPLIRRLEGQRRLWLAQENVAKVATVQVCDLTPISYPVGAETLLMVGTNGSSPTDADIALEMDRRTERVNVKVGGRTWPVTLFAAREEARYLGRLD